jgi:hypothetical protein
MLLGQEPGHIFPDHIEFQVDGRTGRYGSDVGMLEGVGDDGDVKTVSFDVEDGEAGAVEADGAFFDDEVAVFSWEFEAEFPAAFEFVAFQTDGGGVDVTLDDMAVEPAIHDHAAFEVDEDAGLPGIEVGLLEGLFDGGHAVGVIFYFLDSEAGAVMGDALVDLQFRGEGGLDPESPVAARGFDGSYRAEGFDNSGEHGVEIRKNRGEYFILKKNIVLLPSVNIFKHAHY